MQAEAPLPKQTWEPQKEHREKRFFTLSLLCGLKDGRGLGPLAGPAASRF